MTHRLYISFAEENRGFRDQLVKHLAPLKNSGKVTLLDEETVGFANDIERARRDRLDAADAIVLMVSAGFFDSVACKSDLARAMVRNEVEQIPVVPVLATPCDLRGTPLEHRRHLPEEGKPVGAARNHRAWASVVKTLHEVLAKLPAGKAATPPLERPVEPRPSANDARRDDVVIPPELHLAGKQMQAFCDALVDAFPGYNELAKLVRFELDMRLAEIAPPGPIGQVAFDLVQWAETHDRTSALLRGAVAQNPHNAALRHFVRELLAPRPTSV